MLCNAHFHRRSHAQRLMEFAEIVIRKMESNRRFVVLVLLAESVGEPGELADLHSHREVLPFYM